MTLLAQLSDTHIVARGHKLAGAVDSAALLRSAVRALMALQPQPDAVLFTGDLTDNSEPAEYEHLRSLLKPLQMPLILMAGNHDQRSGLAGIFGSVNPPHSSHQVGDLRLLSLDSVVPGQEHGALQPSQLEWLDATLAERPCEPTLVALHHPPFDSGIRFMDGMGLLQGREGLKQVLQKHTQVERLLCGHVHRLTLCRWGGTLALTAPSTAYQIALDLRIDGAAGYVMEPPGFLLHHWRGGSLVTHRVHSGKSAKPQHFG